jgi:hypothetical protein
MANHIRLANALTSLGRHGEAPKRYQRGAGAIPDFRTGEKLARSLFLNDKPREALSVVEKLPAVTGPSDRDRVALLKARIRERRNRQCTTGR